MNHWPFILGAYGFTVLAVVALLWASFAAMRRAEAQADTLRGPK